MISNIVIILFLIIFIHEFGHYLMAKFFGKTIKFTFKWINIKIHNFNVSIIRDTWKMPENLTINQQKWIYISGFGLEYISFLIFLFFDLNFSGLYLLIVFLHFLLYPLYTGDYNDFSIFEKED
jgi:hypothetical protein